MRRFLVLTVVMVVCLTATFAFAQSPERISVQLNAAETTGDACRLTFVIRNQLTAQVDALGLDLVMFDRSEGVLRLCGRRFRGHAVRQDDCPPV